MHEICEYEVVPASSEKDTEQTRVCPEIDGEMHGWRDGEGETILPSFQLHWIAGYD